MPSKRKGRMNVAREAALLLYRGLAGEYKQAKEAAAEALGVNVLPSNIEVAEELDKIAEEIEGPSRNEMKIRMRNEALEIMKKIESFNPKLTGSVWRGTAYKGSDIDIVAYATKPEEVANKLKSHGYKIVKTEWKQATFENGTKEFLHIGIVLDSGDEVEVVVKDPEEMSRIERCDIYGDIVKGLNIEQLEQVLKSDPLMKFLPKLGKR